LRCADNLAGISPEPDQAARRSNHNGRKKFKALQYSCLSGIDLELLRSGDADVWYRSWADVHPNGPELDTFMQTTTCHSVRTPALHLCFEQTGPDSGQPILLLHGFPYDVREYDEIRDRIASHDRRIIVPYLRGFGPTRYLSEGVFRSGQQAALGKDIVDLLAVLKIERAMLVGYDWGGRAACVAAALWPERVCALISVAGYTVQDIAKSAVTPQSAEQEKQFWYQWYFQTERGRQGLEKNRDELCKLMWKMWSPTWQFDDRLFTATAKSFHNPDFVPTVIQSYRHRYANAAGDPTLEIFEARLAERPRIACPTIVLHGDEDSVNPPSTSEGQERQFTSHYERRLLRNVGHCPPAEDPAAVIEAIEDVSRLARY
jgi:pimeloyl-ACP methyl ester carboxylesterase